MNISFSSKFFLTLTGALIFLLQIFSLKGFPCELPIKGQIFNASLVESGDFTVNLSSVYTTDQIIQIENNVKACQSLISSRIFGYQEKISSLIRDKATLEGFRNLGDQINRIKTLEAEKVTIQEAFTKDLSQIALKGLYAVILEATVRMPRDELIDAAKKLISPQAINDLRGIAVNSITIVEGSRLIFDRIKTETSGEMDIETVNIEERKFFKGKTQLLYVGVVKVNPLKGKVRNEAKSQETIQGAVADILSGKGISGLQLDLAKFTNEAYASEKMISIKQIVPIWQDVLRQENIQATKKEGELLIQLAKRLSEKDQEIQLAQQKVNDTRKKLRDNFSRVGFSCKAEPETCFSEAIAFMDKKVQGVVNESLKEKEREYVGAKEIVRGAGDPEKEIYRLTRDLVQNLKTTYGKSEQFLSVTIVDKMMLTKAEDRQGFYIIRHPKEVSLYPYYDDKGDMHLLLVMNFKVDREGEGSTQIVEPREKPTGATSGPGLVKPFNDPVTGMEFIFIKGGCYEMGATFGDGDATEKPVHEVCIDDFYLGKYEVTQGQWDKVMRNNPSSFKGRDNPVEQVSWNDVQEFIDRLNRQSGRKYRLPTEAEWEYAAKSGGKRAKFSGTSQESELGQYAWYISNSGWQTHPVGQKKPNELGLHDMSGSVWEWCADWYDENYYKNTPKNNPRGPRSGSMRVLRGGSWYSNPWLVRAASRFGSGPAGRNNSIGIRLGASAR